MPVSLRTTIRLRWRDMDGLGHLNQSVYHELLEEGRAALIAARSDIEGLPWVLARVELDHRHEVRHEDGEVHVDVKVSRIGGKSLTLANEILLPDGTVAATGITVLVAWDPERRGARAITDAERASFSPVA